jgi:hypothetical protein
MIRTTTLLPKQVYADIQRLAERVGQQPADVLRDLVQRGLRAQRQEVTTDLVATSARPNGIVDLANLHITGGPRDLSARADHYLYSED